MPAATAPVATAVPTNTFDGMLSARKIVVGIQSKKKIEMIISPFRFYQVALVVISVAKMAQH